ncbi:MAG: putative DNA binding domain-containing protein [Proteobacteria bacterium]|nr:putative DNA binding domain-containing protein [Pseudomonadota bacterium]MBU2227327.1 putative DNA binding domain-containing protein [Pseudomonadota bacterium]MBU2261298.1 putative DNA binding domain-containing protein [Pseudomonadota bacterium]
METPKTVRDIIAKGESAHVEFKSANAGLEVLGKTICAFLNSGGGQIIVGIRDDGGLEGATHSKDIENILRPLSGGGEPGGLITPNAVWDITEEPSEGGSVSIIDVPAGADRPYVFRNSIFIRTGKKSRQATGNEIRALIERRYQQGARWERQPVLEVNLKDLDEKEILETARLATDKRGWRFRKIEDPWAILEDLNLVDHGRLTNAAVILFAREAGHIYPQAQVRATVYASDKAGVSFTDDQVFDGHLFANLEGFEAFVKRHVSTVSEFSAGKAERVDTPTLPYWSLREGFRNALMHRDYSSYQGRVSVGIYPGRMEIWSYGGLPQGLTITSLKKADRSLPVNPDIAQVLFLRGLVDLLGRGTRKIVEEFQSLGLPEPKWKEQAGGITLILLSGAKPGHLPRELNSRQIDILRRMRPGSTDTMASVLRASGQKMSERTVRNDLSKLLKLGYLALQGRGKSTFYIRTEKPLA